MQKTFVKEYIEVMAPIACGLDVLQGEMVTGLGYLLPTLCIILLELLDRPAPLSLTICQSLVRALLDGISSRFGTVFDDTKVQLASAVHPKFKLDWVENQVQKSLVVEQLKRAVEIEPRSEESQQDCPTAFAHETHQDQPHVTTATPFLCPYNIEKKRYRC